MIKLTLFLVVVMSISLHADIEPTLIHLARSTMENNKQIEILKEKVIIEEKNNSWGNAGILPVISLSAAQSNSKKDVNSTYSTGTEIDKTGSDSNQTALALNATLILFDGFGTLHRLDKQQNAVIEAKLKAKISAENMLMQLINYYYEWLRLRDLIEITQNDVSVSQQRLDRLEQRSLLGDISQLDYLQAKVELDRDKYQLAVQQVNIEEIKREIKYLTGLQRLKTDHVEYMMVSPNIEFIRNEAKKKNPGLLLKKVQRSIARNDAELLISSLYPSVYVDYQYGRNISKSDSSFIESSESQGGTVTLGLSFNIFNGLKDIESLDKAEVALNILELDLEDTYLILEKNMTNVFKKLELTNAQTSIDQAVIEHSLKSYEKALELYQLGQLTLIELREYQIQLKRNRFNAITNKYQLKIQEWELIRFSGGLMEHIIKGPKWAPDIVD